MPTTLKSVLLFTSIIMFSISSCKKKDSINNPEPAPKADTLSTGWTKLNPFGNISLNGGADIFFIDQYTGYIAFPNGGIHKSTDGGVQWQQVSTVGAFNLSITPDKTLFAVGSSDNIFRFADGSTTPVTTYLDGYGSKEVFFIGNQAGLSTSGNYIYLTANGGDSWTNIHNLPNIDSSSGRNSVITMSGSNAWIAYAKYILHSNGNNYSSWDLDSVPVMSNNLAIIGISAPTPDIVYAISASGYIYKSTDAGNSFTYIYKPELIYNQNYTSDIHFVSPDIGYINLGNRIYKTTDGGNNWSKVVSLGSTDLLEIHFVDEQHGWGICYDGSVLKLN